MYYHKMSEIQQRLDEAGEAISEENEEIVGMIRELADRVYTLEQENKNIERELIHWRKLYNPAVTLPNRNTFRPVTNNRPPITGSIAPQSDYSRASSRYKPEHPLFNQEGYNAKSSQE